MVLGTFLILAGMLIMATLFNRRLRGKLYNVRRSYLHSKPSQQIRIAMLALLGVVLMTLGGYIVLQGFEDDSNIGKADTVTTQQ